MDIVVDFDGTCVTHAYPFIGDPIGATPVLRELVDNGHNLILFTMRSDNWVRDSDHLTQAVNWFVENKIKLHGVQRNPTQDTWTSSPKAYGQIIIDDAALGCPLIYPKVGRPYADWSKIRKLLVLKGLIKQPTRKYLNPSG